MALFGNGTWACHQFPPMDSGSRARVPILSFYLAEHRVTGAPNTGDDHESGTGSTGDSLLSAPAHEGPVSTTAISQILKADKGNFRQGLPTWASAPSLPALVWPPVHLFPEVAATATELPGSVSAIPWHLDCATRARINWWSRGMSAYAVPCSCADGDLQEHQAKETPVGTDCARVPLPNPAPAG